MSALQQAQTKLKEISETWSTPLPVVELNFDSKDPNHVYGTVRSKEIQSDSDGTNKDQVLPIYCPNDTISGTVDVLFIEGMKEFEFEEISIFFVGQIQCKQIKKHFIFCSQKLVLSPGPGTLYSSTQYDFTFSNIPSKHASFYGSLVKCRYFVRAVIRRKGMHFITKNNITNERDIVVMQPIINKKEFPKPSPLDMQVGVDNCLHIKFHYDSTVLSTDGCLEGSVTILSNTLKITTMQIQLLRREVVTTGSGNKPEISNTEVLGRFELMDGAPSDNEYIPVRLYLNKFRKIGPTMKTKFFDVKYYANLGLIDKDGRRYFKTIEIKLWTKLRQKRNSN